MTYAVKLTTLSALLLIGGLSLAAGAEGRGPSFETLDSNGDGRITQAEMEARGSERFANADTDGNGLLSAAELEAAASESRKKRVERMLERLDTNGDAQLSQEEMAKARRGGGDRMFKRADADSDGAISKEEFDAAMAKRGEKRKSKN